MGSPSPYTQRKRVPSAFDQLSLTRVGVHAETLLDRVAKLQVPHNECISAGIIPNDG